MYVIENKSNPHIQSQKITKWNHLFLRDKVYLHSEYIALSKHFFVESST